MPSTDPSAADGPVEDRPHDAKPVEVLAGDAIAAGPVARVGTPFAFPRDARLLNGRAYDAVFGDNRRIADRFWTVLVHRVPSDTDEAARLGLAVAKKRARRAVDRNRIKRVARESFRHARGELAGRHVVVMNRDAATTASAAELRAGLDALWSRLRRPAGPTEADERRPGGRRSGAYPSGGRLTSSRRVSGGGASSSGPASGDPPDGGRRVAEGERSG